MEKQLVVIENTQLLEVANKSGIELTKAQTYAMKFAPYMQKVNEVMEMASKINKTNPTAEDAKLARKYRLELVPNRTGAEKLKDAEKANLLIETNLIQSLFNVVKNTSQLTENELMEVEKYQERIEAEAKAKLKAERENELSQYCENVSMFPLGEMTAEAYEQLLNGQKLAHAAKVEAERKAAEKKAEEERKERVLRERHLELAKYAQFINLAELTLETTQEEFEKMLENAITSQSNYEAEQARIKAENDRLKKEAEEKEKALQAERQKAEAERKEAEAKAQKEREESERILQAERKAAQDKLEKEQAEARRLAKELADKKAADEKAEADRLAKIEADLAMGDADKMKQLAEDIEALKTKYSFKSKKHNAIYAGVFELLTKVIGYINDKSK
jgi:hypothetical protein